MVQQADSAKAAVESFAQNLAKDPSATLESLGQEAIQFGLKVIAAILIYIIGAWIIKRIKIGLSKMFQRRKTEKALASFISSFTSILLTIILIVITVSTLGVNTTSLAALLAAGGVAIGMALSGTVQNFAGGIMIMAFKPFKAGDFIEAQGYTGTVTGVSIVSTSLTTIDNRAVIIPNGSLSNGTINNYSKHPLRRVDWTISVEYGTDATSCHDTLMKIIKADKRVLDSKTKGAEDPFVALSKLSSSSVDYIVRAWVKTPNYWNVFFDYNQAVYTGLPEAGINFPFAQMDIHLHQK